MKESRELVREVEAGKNNENKRGGSGMKESRELVGEIEAGRNNENKRGGSGMKELRELIKEIENKRLLLVEKVLQWAKSLNPVKDIHIKLKGRYYPLLGKDGKLYLIDKVQGKKIPFDTLEQNMKIVIVTLLAEKKEEIEKEVEDGKRKYLEGKAAEIDKLLSKF